MYDVKQKPISIQPVFFRDQFSYFVHPVIIYGSGWKFYDFWQCDQKENLIKTITPKENDFLDKYWRFGFDRFGAVHQWWYGKQGADFPKNLSFRLVMARTDLLTVVALLKYQDELWNPLYHGHQAAEKALKAFLYMNGFAYENLKKSGHDLTRLILECAKINPTFSRFSQIIQSQMKWDNEWRYTPHNFNGQQIVNMFDGALDMLAEVIKSAIEKYAQRG